MFRGYMTKIQHSGKAFSHFSYFYLHICHTHVIYKMYYGFMYYLKK